jgi:7-carboxy-7-deazaguanine synthase
MASGHLSEVFTSVEGEGVYAGRPASFVRLSGCNLACCYCDTPYARENRGVALIHDGTATREVASPVGCDDLLSLARESGTWAPTVVFTGGEPLLQPGFVAAAAAGLKRLGCSIHLETNGTLPDAMGQVRGVVDFVSADVKLPSTQGGKNLFDVHRVFLERLAGVRAAVKVVVTAGTPEAEVAAAAALVASVNRGMPLLLQPAFEGSRPSVDAAGLANLMRVARSRLPDVRLSVQMHKVLGIR